VLTHVAAWTGDVGDAVGDIGAVATLLGAPEFGETLSGVSAALDVVSAAADFADGNDHQGLLELGSGALMVFTGGLGSLGNLGKFAGLGDEEPEAFAGLSGAFMKIAQEAKDIPDMRDPNVIIRSAQSQKIWGYGGAVLADAANGGLQKLTWSRLP